MKTTQLIRLLLQLMLCEAVLGIVESMMSSLYSNFKRLNDVHGKCNVVQFVGFVVN